MPFARSARLLRHASGQTPPPEPLWLNRASVPSVTRTPLVRLRPHAAFSATASGVRWIRRSRARRGSIAASTAARRAHCDPSGASNAIARRSERGHRWPRPPARSPWATAHRRAPYSMTVGARLTTGSDARRKARPAARPSAAKSGSSSIRLIGMCRSSMSERSSGRWSGTPTRTPVSSAGTSSMAARRAGLWRRSLSNHGKNLNRPRACFRCALRDLSLFL